MPASALTQNIKIQSNGENALHREVSRSQSISFGSTSPQDTFRHRPSWGQDGSFPHNLKRTATGAIAKQLKPFREQDIKILLLENVNQTGKDILQAQGYQVESLKSSLPEDQLIEKIRYSQIILHFEEEADFLAQETSTSWAFDPKRSLPLVSSLKPGT